MPVLLFSFEAVLVYRYMLFLAINALRVIAAWAIAVVVGRGNWETTDTT